MSYTDEQRKKIYCDYLHTFGKPPMPVRAEDNGGDEYYDMLLDCIRNKRELTAQDVDNLVMKWWKPGIIL